MDSKIKFESTVENFFYSKKRFIKTGHNISISYGGGFIVVRVIHTVVVISNTSEEYDLFIL